VSASDPAMQSDQVVLAKQLSQIPGADAPTPVRNAG
jgi:hypothetical protein